MSTHNQSLNIVLGQHNIPTGPAKLVDYYYGVGTHIEKDGKGGYKEIKCDSGTVSQISFYHSSEEGKPLKRNTVIEES